jgi:hypothetical protein
MLRYCYTFKKDYKPFLKGCERVFRTVSKRRNFCSKCERLIMLSDFNQKQMKKKIMEEKKDGV